MHVMCLHRICKLYSIVLVADFDIVLVYTGNQGLEYGTVSLTVSLRGGTSENSVFQWFFDI